MTKNEFIQNLAKRLESLPQEEVFKSTRYYSGQIEDRKEDGMTEEQAVADLESIDIIAQRIIDDYNECSAENKQVTDSVAAKAAPQSGDAAVQTAPKKPRFSDRQVVLLIVLVAAFPLWIGLAAGGFGVYIGLWGAVVGIFAAAFALFVAACSCLVSLPFFFSMGAGAVMIQVGSALLLLGLSFLFGFAAYYAAKGFIKLIVVICSGIAKLFRSKA